MSEKELLECKEIEEILVSINHEIRTPLNAIMGFSNLIAESAGSADDKKYAAIIKTNNERLLQMVETMIGLFKFMVGILDFTKTGTDLNLLLEKLAVILRIELLDKEYNIRFVPPLEKCPAVSVAFERLTQVLKLYAYHIGSYMDKGDIEIGYDCPHAGMVKLFVRAAQSSFLRGKPFVESFTVHPDDNSEQTLGLDLQFCRLIARQMEGKVGISVNKQEQIEIWIKIPLTD